MGVEGEVGPRLPGTPVSVGGRPQAIVTLGATAGGVLGGWLVDRAGRKLSLLLCTVPFVIGFAVITAAQDVWMLLGGRLLTGLACGVASLVAPVSVPSFTPWDKGKEQSCRHASPGRGLLGAPYLLYLPYFCKGLAFTSAGATVISPVLR